MEEEYMLQIYNVFALKTNQDLTVKEQQNKIVEILRKMRKETEDWQKIKLNNHIQEAVKRGIDEVLGTKK